MNRKQLLNAFIEEQKYAPSLNTITPATFHNLTKGYFKPYITPDVLYRYLKEISQPEDFISIIDRLLDKIELEKTVNNNILTE